MSEIALHPNRVAREGGSRLKDLLDGCARGSVSSWTCKKTARKGDLYLFYFGAPAFEIAAVGLVAGPVNEAENAGEWDWTSKHREWFCRFRPLRKLDSPITRAEIERDPELSRWWRGRPFQGGSKLIALPYGQQLLSIIARRNPAVRDLAAPFLPEAMDPPQRGQHPAPRASKGRQDQSGQVEQLVGDLPAAQRQRVLREIEQAVRDARLRPAVLKAWGRACAACGMELGVSGQYEVEVAHVRGVADGGMDQIANALPLCRTHHWAFDRGLWAVEPKTLSIRVRPQFAKHRGLAGLAGRTIAWPRGASPPRDNLLWSWQKFRGASR